MRWHGVDCQDAAGRPIALRNLLRANSSAPTTRDPDVVGARARAAQKLPKAIGQPAASISLRL
eukprot:COSAG05_NODE_707_length_7848_cov_6.252420_4_plen_63_part_00